jgi:hypothetical protein
MLRQAVALLKRFFTEEVHEEEQHFFIYYTGEYSLG